MEKILTINGIEYIQKAEYDKAQQDVENIKQMVSSSIADLTGLLGTQKVVSKEKEEKPVPQGYVAKRNKDLQIRVAGQKIYKIINMDESGHFYGKPNKKLIFDVRDVIAINKQYNNKTTKESIQKMSKDFSLPIDTIHRIIYNIDQNTFIDYVKEYLSSVNEIKIKNKKVSTQNNPQKRKEGGYYTV